MRRVIWIGVGLAGLLSITGCSRVAVTTTVKEDGSWSRKDVFRQPKSTGGNAQLADVFQLPSGSDWKTSKVVVGDEVTYTARLAVKEPAQFGQDIQVRRKNKGPVLVTNHVVVQELSPGRWQYTETLHWNGTKPRELAHPPAEVTEAIKAALPERVASTAVAAKLAPGLIRGVWGAVFGPGQSLLPAMILQPDAAEHILRQRIGSSIDRALGEVLGSRITPEERRSTVVRLLSTIAQQTHQRSSQSGDKHEMDGTDMPALTFTLCPPGRILETNGETDTITNEVYWSMYPEAAALGDVVMRATWEAPEASAGKAG